MANNNLGIPDETFVKMYREYNYAVKNYDKNSIKMLLEDDFPLVSLKKIAKFIAFMKIQPAT